MSDNGSSDPNARALAILRISVGLLFLVFAEYKIFGTEFTGRGFQFWISKFIEQGAYPFIYMLTLLFSADYPGAGAAFWEYFGNSLSHSVFALCFIAFLLGRADAAWSVRISFTHK
jgi:hypothetical protein